MTNAQRRRQAKAIAKAQRLQATPRDRTNRERSFNRAFHLHLVGQGR